MADSVPKRSLFVVGDDAQSIYGFRGSKVEIILNFEKDYPNTKEIILNQNYRSTQPILDLAEQILTHNQYQKRKHLFTENKEQSEVIHYHATSERDEAEFIIKRLHELYGKQKEMCHQDQDSESELELDDVFKINTSFPNLQPVNTDPISKMFDVYLETEEFGFSSPTSQSVSWSSWQLSQYNWRSIQKLDDCVVLYRTHSQSRSLEEVFLKYNLPYRLLAGVKFLERKEIKDVLSILRWLSNNEDKLSLGRFLPLLLDGVGTKTLEKIMAFLEDKTYPLPSKNQQQVNDLFFKMQSVWSDSNTLAELVKKVIYTSGYDKYLKQQYPNKDEFAARMENINELYSLILPFDQDETVSIQDRLKAFLDKIALMSSIDDRQQTEDSPKINLMTLHQSKGLEFETVFLVGVEDSLLPHQNSLLDPNSFAEEVRLAYVGVTRAKKYLHLVSCQSRIQFGQVKTNPISRIFRPFLDKYCKRVIRY